MKIAETAPDTHRPQWEPEHLYNDDKSYLSLKLFSHLFCLLGINSIQRMTAHSSGTIGFLSHPTYIIIYKNSYLYSSISSTLLLLEMEYSNFMAQYHTCWCHGSVSHQSISRHGIGCVGQNIYCCSRVNFFYLGKANFSKTLRVNVS